MLDWLSRVFGRRRAVGDAAYERQMREHARVMAHAAKALPNDPVIRAENRKARSWIDQQYADRMRGHR